MGKLNRSEAVNVGVGLSGGIVLTSSLYSHAWVTGSSLISPLSPFHTTSPSHSPTTTQSSYYTSLLSTTSLSPYHTTNVSVQSSPSSTPKSNSATPNVTAAPSPKPEPSQDKFTLLLYAIPPLAFVVIVVIAIFMVR